VSGSFSFDVRIAQGQCTYSTQTSRTFTGGAQTFPVNVTVTAPSPLTPTDCAPWSAASLSAFMTVTNAGPFSGSSSATVDISANNTAGSRNGAIRISFGGSSFDIAVTQLQCSYTVGPSLFNNFPAVGGTIDVNVTTGSGCTWTTSSLGGNGFIVQVTAGGTGSGVARFTVQPNPGAARTGSVEINHAGAFQEVVVSQAGATAGTASFTFTPNPCTISGSNATQNCTFDATASTAGSGTIVAYIWNYLGQTSQTSSPTFVPTLGGCGLAGGQQVLVPVTLQVRNSFNLTSAPFNLSVTVRKVNACGFGQ